jgi:hypothetical protein
LAENRRWTRRLLATLEQLLPYIQTLSHPWWLFGSAAMALHGAHPIEIGDVDLLVSRADAPLLLGRLGLPLVPGTESDRFHSDVFATWSEPPLKVEILAGFRVRVGEAWQEVRPRTRQPIELPFGTVYVPDVPELIALCRCSTGRRTANAKGCFAPSLKLARLPLVLRRRDDHAQQRGVERRQEPAAGEPAADPDDRSLKRLQQRKLERHLAPDLQRHRRDELRSLGRDVGHDDEVDRLGSNAGRNPLGAAAIEHPAQARGYAHGSCHEPASAQAFARAARAEAVQGDRPLPRLDDGSGDAVSLRGLVEPKLAARHRRGSRRRSARHGRTP